MCVSLPPNYRLQRTVALAELGPSPPNNAGSPVEISSAPGSRFRAFNSVLSGQVLQVVPKRLIVQSWRSPHWGSDLDSTLILTFLREKDGGRIELVQVNVVETDFAGVCHGWEKFYWTPWRAYLSHGGTHGA